MHLDGFYNRVQISLNAVKEGKRKMMPIVIYKECSNETVNKLRMLGFIAYDIGSIFGTRIYSIINKLEQINKIDFSENIDKTINTLLTAIEESGQEDALRTLKGVLFEALLYPLLKTLILMQE